VRLSAIIAATAVLGVSACASVPESSPTDPRLTAMASSIDLQLQDQVVGYGYALGRDTLVTGAGGLARTSADGEAVAYTPETPMIIASVSKWVSALATMRLLQDKGLSLDDPIGPYFPSDWQVDPYFRSLTFAQLLTHKSGIKTHGNGPMSVARLQTFFSQSVDLDSTVECRGFQDVQDASPISPGNLDYCYSNFNAAILGVLLPNVDAAEPSDLSLPRQYERLVQTLVFEPVGVTTATCAPSDDAYALSYIYPGDAPGKDWGEQYGRCATGGWYLSPVDLAKVLASVAAKDGRILTESEEYSSLDDIRARGLGLDRKTPEMIEKAGVLGDDPGVLATSAMILFPADQAPFAAVLFTNSTTAEGRIAHPRPYLERAYAETAEGTP